MGSAREPQRPGAAPGRVVALGSELRRLHDRIRLLLDDARDGIAPDPRALHTDLVVHCRTFCSVLDEHHRTEDAVLFPWLLRTDPGLGPVIAKLEQDHAMIAHLLGDLAGELARGAPGSVVLGHLEGLDAIMESHFRFEERELVGVLDSIGAAPALGDSFWRGGTTSSPPG